VCDSTMRTDVFIIPSTLILTNSFTIRTPKRVA